MIWRNLVGAALAANPAAYGAGRWWVIQPFAAEAAPTTGTIFFERTNKTPERVSDQGFWNLILTMTYSHMGKPHTTIGDASFHC